MRKMREVLNEILEGDLSHGEILRGKRIEAGLSQDDLAEITGIARTNISALENDRKEMTSYYALIFAAALKTHPSELLYPSGKFNKTEEFLRTEKRAEEFSKRRA